MHPSPWPAPAVQPATHHHRPLLLSALALSCALLAACGKEQQGPGQMPPPPVGVVTVAPASVPIEIELSGRLEPIRTAQVRALSTAQVKAIGITNQRETTVVWNRKTGVPIHHAIVWQDRRAEPTCADLRERGLADTIQVIIEDKGAA